MLRRKPNQRRYRWRALAGAVIGLAIVPGARGQSGVIEHEFIPPDPAEDLALGALTPSGKMPAAIRANGGLVSAPDPYRSAQSSNNEPTYGPAGSKAPRFQIDGVTSDPGTLHYHEPFRPSIAPFKRLRAFDAVNDAFELVVRDSTARDVSLDSSPRPGEDEFFGDLAVTGGRAVAIPSVAGGMRVLAAELEPTVAFTIAVDSAENWYFEAPTLVGKARLVTRVAASRAALSSEFNVSSYTSLTSALNLVPAGVVRAATPVLERIGISRVNSPTDAVRALIAYFRGFTPSNDHFTQLSGRDLYQRLALSQKGVCRHRAYAFMITAMALGIPTRFVHNEAHAWVEVFDGSLWHRVDLGGAAPSFHFDGEVPQGAPYRMPSDKYGWPAHASPAAQSGVDASDQPAVTQVPTDAAPGAQASAQAAPVRPEPNVPPTTPSASQESQKAPAVDSAAAPPASAMPIAEAQVAVVLKSSATPHRGEPLVIDGKLEKRSDRCPRERVDLTLQSVGAHRALGSTITDEHGHFHFETFVPIDVPVGRYEITAQRRESAACAE